MELGRKRNRKSSGQLLIVAALAIAILISSTTTYVYELSKETTNAAELPIDNFVFAVNQAARNAVIGSLANVSNGGLRTVLVANLNLLVETTRSLRRYGMCNLAYLVANESGYESGTLLSWGTNGTGISSAYSAISLRVQGVASQTITDTTINISSSLTISGRYTMMGGGEKNVSLTCTAENEDQPALIRNIAVFYNDGGNWTQASALNDLSVTDLGSGTYVASFVVDVPDPVEVSVHILDLRNIFVRANVSCPAY